MTQFTKRYTISCPLDQRSNGNRIGLYLGRSRADIATFGEEPNYRLPTGELFIVASTVATVEFAQAAATPTPRVPEFAEGLITVPSIRGALDMFRIYKPIATEDSLGNVSYSLPPELSMDNINAIEHPDPRFAIRLLGLELIPGEAA